MKYSTKAISAMGLLCAANISYAASCAGTFTYTHTGIGSGNYSLSSGQSLKIADGTFTGYIDAFANGSQICVENGATFTPAAINNIAGTLNNYGTTNLATFVYNTGAVIDNYGTLNFTGGLNTNGATSFYNRADAQMSMAASFQLGLNSSFTNDGLLITQQDFNTESGTTLTNNYRMELVGNFNPDGKVDNYGRIYAKAFINVNQNSEVINHCTFVAYDGFNNNSPLMRNLGTLLITQPDGTPGGLWQNNQPFYNGANAKIAGGDFFNNGSFSGGGSLIFAGDTRNQSAFTGESASSPIVFYDETQTANQLFDAQGVVPINTLRQAFTRPTELDAPDTCSSPYKNFAVPSNQDYGDAPASYGSAGHTINAAIHLGAITPDAENSNQSNFNASGDGSDEDGAPHPVATSGPSTAARFPVLKLHDTSYSSPFTVTNTTGTAGTLYAWIDFDKNGTFTADEATAVSVPSGTNNGTVTLNWSNIPSDMQLGTTFIRTRLTTDTHVTTATPTGFASNGEVEDYPIAIYQAVPANSTQLSILSGVTPTNCQSTVFSDNFNDVAYISWGANNPTGQAIRNWTRAGGGTDTYADVEDLGSTQGKAVYFGNGTLRGISPAIPNGYSFDSNGKLTTTIEAIALRDVPDDLGKSHWGPEPVTLATSIPTTVGKAYRLYFKAIPETDPKEIFTAGIMRVDVKGTSTESIHFKAPDSVEAAQDYAIEFTATAASTSITFVNYGHVDSDWCDPQTTDWCTEGGTQNDTSPNELIIDDVVVAAVDACQPAIRTINGTVFEDVNYGGGAGRAFGTSGTLGINGATVELYDATGKYLSSTTTSSGGSYSFGTLPDADYFVRVVNDSVSSSRSSTTGDELAVQTFRSSNLNKQTTHEIGGRNPFASDATANTTAQTLNTTTFILSDGGQAQSVQPLTLNGSDINGANFGFNFDTIVNANDNGQGSLRQFLFNANQLTNDANLMQVGLTTGKENAVFMLVNTDPHYDTTGKYWRINLSSSLPNITAPVVLDSALQSGFTGTPLLEIDGSKLSASTDGLTLSTGSDGSIIRELAINHCTGNGITLNDTQQNMLQGNHIGISPLGTEARGNMGSGIYVNNAKQNLIGGTTTNTGNNIANNGGDGITIIGNTSVNNSLLGNNIHSNVGLGIDLNNDGITQNDTLDTDSGANDLLNYPSINSTSFGANGSRIITYDFNLDLPTNALGYRLEFFKNTNKDESGNGEGQVFLGSKDIIHPGNGTLEFKGSFNANQAVSSTEFIAMTVTAKTSATAFGSTSEFSGATGNNTVLVCTDLITNPNAALPDLMIDENSTSITYLKATDANGNPLTYAISGGADAAYFTTGTVTNGTVNCTEIKFVSSIIIKDVPLAPLNTPRATNDPTPGNYELPLDADRNNAYELQMTATDRNGKSYVRTLNVKIANVNEAPIITSAASISLAEDQTATALDIASQDVDAEDQEGTGLSYSLSGGADAKQFQVDAATGVLNFNFVPDYDTPVDSDVNNVYEVAVTVTDHAGLSMSKTFTLTITNNALDDGVKLQAKVLLQGTYNNNTARMNDTLRSKDLLPMAQPYSIAPFNYSGTETLNPTLKTATDNKAVVDWILVDLRTSANTLVATRAVMLQRDGTLVDAQTGANTVHFASIPTGNYYVSVRHRNHLGVMTASPISLSATAKAVDFTSTTTPLAGNDTRYVSGDTAMLWVGDVNNSQTLTANGPNNDMTKLLSSVVTASENTAANTNYIVYGYAATDLNMDGKTLFTGPANDASTLIGNIILHPANSNYAANYIVKGGMAQ